MNIDELVDKLRFIDLYLPHQTKSTTYQGILTFAETQLSLSAPKSPCKEKLEYESKLLQAVFPR